MAILKFQRIYILLLPLILMLNHNYANAQGTLQLYEQDIKAGILYNFVKYTNWPPEIFKSKKLNLCIYGNDDFGDYLQKLKGRSVNQKEILVSNIYSSADLASCHVLFMSNSEMLKWPELKIFLTNKHILTISDYHGFSDSGGMIEFVRINNRINVNLNMEQLNKAELQVNDRMLKLVNIVNADTGGGR